MVLELRVPREPAYLPKPWFADTTSSVQVGWVGPPEPAIRGTSTAQLRQRGSVLLGTDPRTLMAYGQGEHWVCVQTGPVGIPVEVLQRNSVRNPFRSATVTLPSFV